MSEIFLALVTGSLVGIVFTAAKLPIPAPPVISGIVGIFGIFLGSQLYQWIIKTYFS